MKKTQKEFGPLSKIKEGLHKKGMTELRYDEEAVIKEVMDCEGHGKNEDLRLPRRPLRLQQKEQR